MLLETERSSCILRPWRDSDKPDLIQNANNRSAIKDGCLIDSVVYVYFPPLQNPPKGSP